MNDQIEKMNDLIMKQSLTILEQKEKIEKLEVELANLNQKLINLNVPQVDGSVDGSVDGPIGKWFKCIGNLSFFSKGIWYKCVKIDAYDNGMLFLDNFNNVNGSIFKYESENFDLKNPQLTNPNK